MFHSVFPSISSRLHAAVQSVSSRVVAIAAAATLCASATAAQAETILTIVPANGGAVVELDRDALMALPRVSVRTSTIWTEGVVEFEGVSLATLVDQAGLTAETMSFIALNDYAVTIPLDDAVEGGPIVADTLNGAPMSVRDKGPLWVIYPFDDNTDYQSEQYYSRSIWQLHRIEPTS